jgi:diguanylate cyclase (GGDEF)-like protein/PAS domain S-box-containing protein
MLMGILFVSVIPSLICLVFSLIFLPPLLEQLEQEKSVEMAESLATTLSTIVEERQQHAKDIALDPQILQAAANQQYDEIQNSLINEYSDRLGPSEGYFVADRDGIIRVDNTGTMSQGQSIRDSAYFRQAESWSSAISEPFSSEISNRSIIVFCHPLTDDDRFYGMIGLALDLSALQQLVDAVKLGQTGYSLILAKNGVFVSHPDSNNILKTNALSFPGMEKLAQHMTGLSSGVEDFTVAGEQRTAGFAPVPEVSWSIAVTQVSNELLAPAREATRWILLSTLGVLIFSVLLAFFVSKRLFYPVKRLSRSAQALSKKNAISLSEKKAKANLDNVIESLNLNAPSLLQQISAILKDSQRQSEALFNHDQSIKTSEDLLSAFSQSEEKIQEFYDSAAEGIFQATLKGQIQEVNSALVRILDYESKQEMRNDFSIIEEQLFPETTLHHLIEQEVLEATEIKLKRKEGEDCWASFSASLIRDNEGEMIAIKGVLVDISEKKRQELEMLWLNQQLKERNLALEKRVEERTRKLILANKQLDTLAMTDPLTGIPNRRRAMLTLQKLWEEAEQKATPLACIMIDADHFKQVNDNYGHDAGDIVLIALATELTDSVRTDDLVCRLGGDEFLILCPATDLKGGLQLAKQIHSAISTMNVTVPGGSWSGSISVGVSAKDNQAHHPEDLIKSADNGVILAKNRGKNCVALGSLS